MPKNASEKVGINEIKYFPDGTRLAVASTIGIWIYDVHTCKPLELITGHTGPVNSLVFSPDGGTFATASDDNDCTFVGYHSQVSTKQVSSDIRILLTLSRSARMVKNLLQPVTTKRLVSGTCKRENR